MTRANKTKVERLMRHCRMFFYASNGFPEVVQNTVAEDFLNFGLLHLTCTMFITTDSKNEPHGGVFHRLLDPMGQGHLVRGVDAVLGSRVGKTTLRQYLRNKRNRLATHGDLAFGSQFPEVQDVTINKKSLKQFCSGMSLLEKEARILFERLQQLTATPTTLD